MEGGIQQPHIYFLEKAHVSWLNGECRAVGFSGGAAHG